MTRRRPNPGSPDPPPESPALTPKEAADLFGVNPKTVTRWAKAGKIPSFLTIGGHRRFRRADVEEAMTATWTGYTDNKPSPPEER